MTLDPRPPLDYATPAAPAAGHGRLWVALASAVAMQVFVLEFAIFFKDGGSIAAATLVGSAVHWLACGAYLATCRGRPSTVGAHAIVWGLPALAYAAAVLIA